MSATPATVPPTKSRDVVAASLGHLARIVQSNGRFIYAHEADDTGDVHEGYNLLRHCGTLWFMASAINTATATADDKTIQAMRRATAFVGRKIEPVPWSAPEQPALAIVGGGVVKLGGLGLGLLALSEVQKVPMMTDFSPKSLPGGLTDAMTGMRRYALDEIGGDDFRHKREFPSGRVTAFRSDYYTGEAIFGLLMTGPTTDELTHVTTSLMRKGYGFPQHSHWMTYAACEAVERDVVPEALGSAYLTGLMETILREPAYRFRRQSTPIACRSEALTRVLLLDRKRPGLLSADLLQRVRFAAAENLAMQLDWYKDGQFWMGDSSRKVQIDFIQHNATGFMNWALLEEG